jgi:peptidoglycan/xylan/chitin deacetylase (PgdA/CDA1 family)
MSWRSQIGDVRRQVWCSINRRPVQLGKCGPVITFSFDDFPRSALTIGAPILEKFGARATYYTSMALMNTHNDLGEQFTHADLCSLVDRGHELASHTFSHASARNVGFHVFRRDVEKGEIAIQESIGTRSSRNFAYPYGDVTLRAKRELGLQMRSCRGTCGGFNGPLVDLNLLRANSLYGDVDRAEAAKRLIVENEERKQWLIFYSHDVAAEPSAFGCSPQLLEEVCSFAAHRGARFATVAEVVAEIAQQDTRERVETKASPNS